MKINLFQYETKREDGKFHSHKRTSPPTTLIMFQTLLNSQLSFCMTFSKNIFKEKQRKWSTYKQECPFMRFLCSMFVVACFFFFSFCFHRWIKVILSRYVYLCVSLFLYVCHNMNSWLITSDMCLCISVSLYFSLSLSVILSLMNHRPTLWNLTRK